MRKLLPLAAVLFGFAASAFATDPPGRERVSFNSGWRFHKGDAPNVGESLAYERIKAWVLPTGGELVNFSAAPPVRPATEPGLNATFARVDFDDTAWRPLDLPHDWGIEGPFQQELSGSTGKLPWAGIGWYRKIFPLPAADTGRQIWLELDGAMSHALVWCNGRFAGGWPYGYTSWRIDLTSFLKPGADNVLAIRLENPRDSSRWYPGAGIYRNTWLVKTATVAIAQWGVQVTTPFVARDSATVEAAVTVENRSSEPAQVQVVTRLYAADADGHPVGDVIATGARLPLSVGKNSSARLAHAFVLAAPRLWSLTQRHRYVAVTTVGPGGREGDRVETPFGLRTIAFTADRGFLLNGERVPLQGVCNHHDLGALGTALNLRALERQLEILQSMGCNAIRTSHNPPAPELLELCDRMGFLVMVEAFDCWRVGKRAADYGRLFDDWHEKDLRAMLRRDRNHPSVIQWSIGNEIREQRDPEGWKLAAHLAGIVREEDRTRSVTAGLHVRHEGFTVAGYNGLQSALDVVGFNYKPAEYGQFRQRNPALPILGSETASTVSSRGEYFFPVSDNQAEGRADFQVSSYDLCAPAWAFPPDAEFKGLDESPFVAGEFVWTGFDYLGEPTPYNNDVAELLNFTDPAGRTRAVAELKQLGRIAVPSRSSYFGIVDLAGFPKDRYYLYQARWRPDLPMAHILPHWNWPERVGQITPVHVYSSGDEAELFLNGRSLGRKKRGASEYRFRWDDVSYAPGELKVVTYKGGTKWAEAVQRTTGSAASLALAPDRAKIRADGHDLSFVTVSVVDREGRLVPRAKHAIKFTLTGPGEIVATDNGDATSHESFQAPARRAYNGLALVIIRAKPGEPGALVLRAEADGLVAGEVALTSN